MHEILLNIESKEIRYALLKNGELRDLIIERKKERQLTGNIYRGKVKNILHNIQSAFIDINEGKMASSIFQISSKTQKNLNSYLTWTLISTTTSKASMKKNSKILVLNK